MQSNNFHKNNFTTLYTMEIFAIAMYVDCYCIEVKIHGIVDTTTRAIAQLIKFEIDEKENTNRRQIVKQKIN